MSYFKTNGFANANIMAIPTPIKKAASIKPANKNILVCNSFMSSGWRAADSKYLLPMIPIPIHAPMAPRPMIKPLPVLQNQERVPCDAPMDEIKKVKET